MHASCLSVQFSTQFNIQSLGSDSAIGIYLVQNLACALHYDDSRCPILSIYLCALEAIFVKIFNVADQKNSCIV